MVARDCVAPPLTSRPDELAGTSAVVSRRFCDAPSPEDVGFGDLFVVRARWQGVCSLDLGLHVVSSCAW